MREQPVTSSTLSPQLMIPRNRFGLSEWSGAFGDLGTLLPLAFALVVLNGFPAARIFLLWGLAYVVTGWFFRVPVAVQPLKAMAVIAISAGIPAHLLSATAVLYGLIMLLLAQSGMIGWMKRLFSRPIVGGIQLGIGLILARKAVQIVLENGLLLNRDSGHLWVTEGIMVVSVGLMLFLIHRKLPAGVILVTAGVLAGWLVISDGTVPASVGSAVAWAIPDLSFLWTAIPLLIVPQLPLTLGNAVFAADDVTHTFWGDQARRVTPKRLTTSIGVCDIGIGLLGGFPICHGSGGMAAHERFGAKTGGATIIMGAVLVITALVPGMAGILFLIPVPILGAMLLIDGIRMALLTAKLGASRDVYIAFAVGLVSFLTRNLTVGMAAGLAVTGMIRAAEAMGLLGAIEYPN